MAILRGLTRGIVNGLTENITGEGGAVGLGPVQYNSEELKRRLIVNGGADVRMIFLHDSNGTSQRMGNPLGIMASNFGPFFKGFLAQGTNVAAAWSSTVLNLGQIGAPDTHDSRFGSGTMRDCFDYRLQQAVSNVSGHTIAGQYLGSNMPSGYADTGAACKAIIKKPLSGASNFLVNGRIHANRSTSGVPNGSNVDDTADFTVTDGGGWMSTPWVYTNADPTNDRHGACLTFDDGGDETGNAAGIVGMFVCKQYRGAADRRGAWHMGLCGDGGWSTVTHARSSTLTNENYWEADTLLSTIAAYGEDLPNIIVIMLGHNDATSSQAADPDEYWANIATIQSRIDALYTSMDRGLPLYWVVQLWNFPNLFANGKSRIATYYGIAEGAVTQALADQYWDEYAVKAEANATGRIGFTSLNRVIGGVIPDAASGYDWLSDGVHITQGDTAAIAEAWNAIYTALNAAATLPAQVAPELIEGIAAWWDAQDSSSIDTSGTFTWTDRLGSKAAVDIGSGFSVGNGINGHPTVLADGTSVLAVADDADISFIPQTDPFSLVGVYRPTFVGNIICKGNAGTGGAIQWNLGTSANDATLACGGITIVSPGALVSYPSNNIQIGIVPGAAGDMFIYLNGEAQGSGANGSAVPTTEPDVTIGGRRSVGNTSSGFRIQGDIGEILVCPFMLTDSQRVLIEDYLSDKWDIALA